jgi:3-hydroxybutyryl-CoA dehydrogenase
MTLDVTDATRSRVESRRPSATEELCVVGSGVIACQIAALRATTDSVALCARSASSAKRARNDVLRLGERLGDGFSEGRVAVETDLDAVEGCTFVIEAITEDADAKGTVLRAIGDRSSPRTIIATTTSSLSIEALATASGHPDRFLGFHVFNPVPRMPLVELAFPPSAAEGTRRRARDLAETLGKRSITVPDAPGFVVNRLLFPFLLSAISLMDEHDLAAADIDEAIKLGLAHPIGPLALLDLIGLDVAQSIAQSLGLPVPQPLAALVESGALGRKSGRGFFDYG